MKRLTMRKRKTLRALLRKINKVWEGNDALNSWVGVIWLVEKQIKEIKDAKYEANAVLKEMADILIIITRYLDKIGIDPEKLMLHRLQTRHAGKTEEIVKKYAKMFDEEQEQRLRAKRDEFNFIFMEYMSWLDSSGKLQLSVAKEHIWKKVKEVMS